MTGARGVVNLVTGRDHHEALLARVRWAPYGEPLDRGAPASPVVEAQVPHERLELAFSDLRPNRRYSYRVEHSVPGERDWSALPEASFRTQKTPGHEFRFAVVSDAHWGSKQVPGDSARHWSGEQCLRQIFRDDPLDFVVDLGDSPFLRRARSGSEALDCYLEWRRLMGEISPHLPVFLVLGNHEREAGFYQRVRPPGPEGERSHPEEPVQKWATAARLACVPNPRGDTYPEGGEGAPGVDTRDEWTGEPGPWSDGPSGSLQNFYAWTWGDALFVTLDPFRYTLVGASHRPRSPSDWTLGPTQRQWLEATLAGSDARWKIILCHHLVGGGAIGPGGHVSHPPDGVCYGRGSAHDATREGTEQAAIHRMMVRHGAQFFVYGHDHLFCHSVLDEVNYVCAGRPTFLNRWLDTPGMRGSYGDVLLQGRDKPWVRAMYNVLGYTRFHVAPDAIAFEWIRTGFSFENGLVAPGEARRDWRESWAGLPYDVESSASVQLRLTPTDVDGVRTVEGARIASFGALPPGAQYYEQPDPVRPEAFADARIRLQGFPERVAVVDTVPELVYRFQLRD